MGIRIKFLHITGATNAIIDPFSVILYFFPFYKWTTVTRTRAMIRNYIFPKMSLIRIKYFNTETILIFIIYIYNETDADDANVIYYLQKKTVAQTDWFP